jgi:MFS family permease
MNSTHDDRLVLHDHGVHATFGKEVLHLSSIDALPVVTVCVGVSNLIWLPLSGALSDRIGRRPALIAFTMLALVTAYPAVQWLVAHPSFLRLLSVELWLSFVYASYNGAMVVALTEVMPADVRTAGFSLAYSLATTIGGFTPAISTLLIRETGNKAAPGLWLGVAALCGLIATLVLYRTPEARNHQYKARRLDAARRGLRGVTQGSASRSLFYRARFMRRAAQGRPPARRRPIVPARTAARAAPADTTDSRRR